jgi:hypothetical protein
MVPPGWEHPQTTEYNHLTRREEQGYQPMYDEDVEGAFAKWVEEYRAWLAGGHDEVIAKCGEADYPKAEPYRAFCNWLGQSPDPKFYRPKWDESAATWFQVYETVSEGTPVTPPFATKGELVEYLCTHGDFWDQRRRRDGVSGDNGPWTREQAERFVERGSAMSLVVESGPQGVSIQEPRDQ